MSRKTGTHVILAIVAVASFFMAFLAWGQPQDPKSLGFKKRFVIEIKNPSSLTLENHPLILSVDEIRAFAPDFNSSNYAIFDETGGDYRLVVSQADELTKDRLHGEIVFLRTLPPSSTTQLACYYSPNGSFQLMMSTAKAYARLGGGPGSSSVGWESNLAAFKFLNGRIEAYGKLYPGLVLRKTPADDARLQAWGTNILSGGASLGLGGLSVWDGKNSLPLAASALGGDFEIQRTVLAAGPLRALVKVEYFRTRPGQRDFGTVVLFSAFADNIFSRQDVIISAKASGPVIYGASLQKLGAEEVSFDKDKGLLAAWGRGSEGAGAIGLAVLFTPSDCAGLDENGAARAVKLNARPGRKLTIWTLAGWSRGIVSATPPATKNWAQTAADLGFRLRVPVEVRFKSN
jgi:hypothetical protein